MENEIMFFGSISLVSTYSINWTTLGYLFSAGDSGWRDKTSGAFSSCSGSKGSSHPISQKFWRRGLLASGGNSPASPSSWRTFGGRTEASRVWSDILSCGSLNVRRSWTKLTFILSTSSRRRKSLGFSASLSRQHLIIPSFEIYLRYFFRRYDLISGLMFWNSPTICSIFSCLPFCSSSHAIVWSQYLISRFNLVNANTPLFRSLFWASLIFLMSSRRHPPKSELNSFL